MHVTSALATGATAYSFPQTGDRVGTGEGHAMKESAEQNAKQQEATASAAAEQKRATEAAKSGQPLHVSDFGYSGVLNPGQMTIIMLEDYSRKMEEIASMREAVAEQEAAAAKRSESDAAAQTQATTDSAAVDGSTATGNIAVSSGIAVASESSDDTISGLYDSPNVDPTGNGNAKVAAQTYQHRADELQQQNLATA